MKQLCLALLCLALPAFAAEPIPAELKDLEIQPKLGAQVDLDLPFKNEKGETVRLRQYFDGRRPVALILNYYGCPMLCGLVLNAARDSFADMDWLPGEKFQIVTVSFDPKEGPDLAKAKKRSILDSVENPSWRASAENGWHFLTGPAASSAKLSEQVGFRYRWVEKEKQYAHGAALFVLSPSGKLTRVLFGMGFHARDLKLSLLEASAGKVGTIAEKILLFCYHYDPKENKYALLATRLVRWGAAATVVLFVLMYALLYWRKRRRAQGKY